MDPDAFADAPIRPDETRDHAPGWATLLERLAGNARRLYEELTGAAIDGRELAIPRNAQGLYGRDYSGPPHGSAPRHPLAVWAGVDPSSGVVDDGGANHAYIDVPSTTGVTWPMRLRNRGHHAHRGAPYSRGYLALRLARTTAGSSAVGVTIYSSARPELVRATTVTVASTTPTIYDMQDDGNATVHYVDLAPGRNDLGIALSVDAGTVRVYGAILYQRAKRSHATDTPS